MRGISCEGTCLVGYAWLRIWPSRSFGVYRTTARGDFDVFPSENRSSESHDKTKYVQKFGYGGTNQDHERHENHEITTKIKTVHAHWTWLMNVSRQNDWLVLINGHCLLLNILHDTTKFHHTYYRYHYLLILTSCSPRYLITCWVNIHSRSLTLFRVGAQVLSPEVMPCQKASLVDRSGLVPFAPPVRLRNQNPHLLEKGVSNT